MLKDGAQAICDALDAVSVWDEESRYGFAVIALRALADAWAPDGEYTADDLRATADAVERAANE